MTNKDLLLKIKENECYLIGQMPLNDEEINSIMLYAKNRITLDDKFINEEPDLVLSTALVQIAINEYQDGKYWESLKNKFNIDNISPQKQGILGRIFINTLREYKLFELKQNINGAMRYVENIKAHAFVTNNYMEGFFDFLYDYYENNLFRDISNGVEDTLQDLSDYMRTTIRQNSDTIYSNTNGKTKKAYKLLKSTREVIAQCSGEVLYQLFYPSLKIIDDNFYDGVLPKDNSNRFAQNFVEWYRKKKLKYENNRIVNERKEYSHKPYIVFNTNKYVRTPFTLVIPKRRFRSSECNGRVSLRLTIHGFQRPIKQLEVSKNMGTYILEEYRFPLNYPFDEIKIEMIALDNYEMVIPESNYVIFNEDCIKVNRFEKGINYLLVKPETNVKFSNENILIEEETSDEWIQYMLNISDDSICYINNKPLTIVGEFSKEPMFEQEITFFDVYDEKENKIIGTRLHPLISFELDKKKIRGTTIQINSNNYLLSNPNILQYDSIINENQLIISVDLNKILPQRNGYYKVELNILEENNKLITEYLLLKNVYFIFDKRRYIKDEEAKLTLKTDGLDIKIVDSECKIIYSNEYRKNYYFTFNLNSRYRVINAILNFENKLFYIKVPIKMMLIGFSQNNLYYGNLNNIWYSNLQPLMYIKLPGAKKLGVYSNEDFNKVVLGDEIAENFFRVNISSLIEDINNSNKKYICLYIKYVDNKERFLQIYVVEKSIKIKPYFEFEFYNDIPCFNVEFKEVKGVKIFYSIKEADSYKEIVHHRELKQGINYLPEIKRNIYYNIYPIMEENDEFGLNNKIKSLPTKKHEGIISYVKNTLAMQLIGNKFFIKEIFLKEDFLEINRLFKYKIEIINQQKDYYYGKLYEVEYFTKFNNPDFLTQISQRTLGDVRISNINKNELNEIYFTMENFSKLDNEWYELYYDKDSKRIIENDNSILEKITYSSVIVLECSNTKYVIKLKK